MKALSSSSDPPMPAERTLRLLTGFRSHPTRSSIRLSRVTGSGLSRIPGRTRLHLFCHSHTRSWDPTLQYHVDPITARTVFGHLKITRFPLHDSQSHGKYLLKSKDSRTESRDASGTSAIWMPKAQSYDTIDLNTRPNDSRPFS